MVFVMDEERIYYPHDPEEKDPVIVKLKKLMEGLPNGGGPDISYMKDKPVAITVEGETFWLYDLDTIDVLEV